jgi:hypothetical protein
MSYNIGTMRGCYFFIGTDTLDNKLVCKVGKCLQPSFEVQAGANVVILFTAVIYEFS